MLFLFFTEKISHFFPFFFFFFSPSMSIQMGLVPVVSQACSDTLVMWRSQCCVPRGRRRRSPKDSISNLFCSIGHTYTHTVLCHGQTHVLCLCNRIQNLSEANNTCMHVEKNNHNVLRCWVETNLYLAVDPNIFPEINSVWKDRMSVSNRPPFLCKRYMLLFKFLPKVVQPSNCMCIVAYIGKPEPGFGH